MPRIPSFEGRSRISVEVPRVQGGDSRGARIIAQAEQSLIASAEKLGVSISDYNKKKELAEKDAYVNKAINELNLASSDIDTKASLAVNADNYKDFAKSNLDASNKIADRLIKEAPNEAAKKELEAKFTNSLTNNYIAWERKQAKLGSDFKVMSLEQDADSNVDAIFSKVDLDLAVKAYDNRIDAVNKSTGITISAATAEKLKANDYKYAQAFLNGAIATGKEKLDAAGRFLAGEIAGAERLLNSLDDAKRASFAKKIEAKKKQEIDAMRGLVNREATVLAKELKAGIVNTNTASGQRLMEQTIAQVNATNKPEDASRIVADIVTAAAENELEKELLLNPSYDGADFAATIPGIDLQAQREVSAEVKLSADKIRNTISDKLLKDGAGYLTDFDPTVSVFQDMAISGDRGSYQDMKSRMDQIYDNYNTPGTLRTYFSPKMKQHFGEGIQRSLETGNPQLAVQLIDDLENMTGGEASYAMKEMKIPGQYAVLGDMQKTDRIRAVNTMFQEDSKLKTAFNGKFESTSEANNAMKEFDTEIRKTEVYQQFRGMSDDIETVQYADSMASAMKKRYMELVSTGTDKEVAFQEAQKIFTNKWAVTFNSRARMNLDREKFKPHEISKIGDYAKNVLSRQEDIVGSLGVELTPGEVQTGVSIESKNADIKRTGWWQNASDGSGLELWYVGRNGAGKVLGKNNQPVKKEFADILKEDKVASVTFAELIKRRVKENIQHAVDVKLRNVE